MNLSLWQEDTLAQRALEIGCIQAVQEYYQYVYTPAEYKLVDETTDWCNCPLYYNVRNWASNLKRNKLHRRLPLTSRVLEEVASDR